MLLQKFLVVGLLAIPLGTFAAPPAAMQSKPVVIFENQQAVTKHLRALGYRARGHVERAMSEGEQSKGRAFPTFSSSFVVGNATYPFTMVGFPPKSGRSTEIKTLIIPLRMNFVYFGAKFDVSHSFDPSPAVTNITNSPMYLPARFPNGTGQFVDQMQRAAFWQQMDKRHEWHVYMDEPKVAPTINIEVTPAVGTLMQDTAGNFLGDVLIDFIDSQLQTILQLLEVGPDTLPIFVTDNVTAQALGYHTAYPVSDGEGGTRVQTFIYTSWLDPAVVPPIVADVSTFNHELAEWTNDPYTNNQVPDWNYPPSTDPLASCSFNPSLEVGDPQGNGPTYSDYPAIEVTLGPVTYHLQQLVLWQWFADQSPSSAFGGWYTFPSPASLKIPAVYCP